MTFVNKVINFLLDIVVSIHDYFQPCNFDMYKAYIHYQAHDNGSDPADIKNEEWRKEYRCFWGDEPEEFCLPIKRPTMEKINQLIEDAPGNCKIKLVEVKYIYNGGIYKMIVHPSDFSWPPKLNEETRFYLPIIKAVILNKHDKMVVDVTQKIKRLYGPQGNFHDKSIKIKRIFDFDDDSIRSTYTTLKITNFVNQTKRFKIATDSLGPQWLS